MITELSPLVLGGLVPALPSSIVEPLWVQFAALLPTRQVHHPLGCHRRRIPDRLVFDKLIQILVFGCGYRRIADATCLPPTSICSGWTLTTWSWTGASPRRPAAAKSPGQARSTVASRA